jgi:hypothetical protein
LNCYYLTGICGDVTAAKNPLDAAKIIGNSRWLISSKISMKKAADVNVYRRSTIFGLAYMPIVS